MMQIRVIRTFKSGKLGMCEAGDIINCDANIGRYIVTSHLGEEIVEAVTTKDVPIPTRRVKRKKKRVTGKVVETATVENGETR